MLHVTQSKEKLLVSISGGRSSAVAAILIWRQYRHVYDLLFVFANTSREKEETLVFLHQLQTIMGLPIVFVEALVHHGKRMGTTHSVTTFEAAKRNGEVFEEVIKKYGIPGKSFPHCTRELKANPIRSYARSLGWKKYKTMIGYRADEPKRVNLINAAKKRQWYPLWEWGIKKSDVAAFWLAQPFDLQLEDWEGNCRLCHKKSKRKLLTQIVADPESTVFISDMQDRYGHIAPAQYKGEKPMRFFRGRQSIEELIAESKEPFNKAVDQSLLTDGADYDFDLDEQEECAESCEPF